MMTKVYWVGDYATIQTWVDIETETDPIEFTRQQLIDWHGIDPAKHGFVPDVEEGDE